jgi:predicted DNA-binding transcriptional regulator AlpA
MITRLLMKKDVASLFGVTVKAVDKWVSERKIPFIRISRKCIRFDENVIEAFLAKRTIKDRVRPSLKTRKRKKREAVVKVEKVESVGKAESFEPGTEVQSGDKD